VSLSVGCTSTGHHTTSTILPFAKWELAVNTLPKVESVKTTLSSMRLVQFTKSKQDLM
jgi:hypothetical protein